MNWGDVYPGTDGIFNMFDSYLFSSGIEFGLRLAFNGIMLGVLAGVGASMIDAAFRRRD